MNNDIAFRFVTRTLSEDYRVFYENGQKQLLDIDEFVPLRKKGRIIPEEGTSFALFEEDNKIFLVASGLKFGNYDKAGRPIRFSFCQIFYGTGNEEREKAFSALNFLISSLSEVNKKIRELITEIPVKKINSQGQEVLGENISFEQNDFINLLQSKRKRNLSFKRTVNGKSYSVENCVWPAKGCILKWIETAPDRLNCYKIGGNNNNKVKRYNKFLWIALAVIILCALAAVTMIIRKTDVAEQFNSEIQVQSEKILESSVNVSKDTMLNNNESSDRRDI